MEPQHNAVVTTETAADSAWWKAFNDPTLDQLIDLAYKQNLSLQIAGLRILEARAQLGYATGRQWPQVQVATGSATAVGISKNSASYIPGFDTALRGTTRWGSMRPGRWTSGASTGAAWSRRRAALSGSVADYDSALVALTAEVARTYA